MNRATSIDFSAAEKLPGVKAIIPVYDELPYQVRFAGQEILGVAAESLELAGEALRLIKVDYDELDFVVDKEKARKSYSHVVHESRIARETTEGDAGEQEEDDVTQTGNIRGPMIEAQPEDITESDIDNLLDGFYSSGAEIDVYVSNGDSWSCSKLARSG